MFNVIKLIAALKDPILGWKAMIVLALIIIGSEKEWKVEEILNSQWH